MATTKNEQKKVPEEHQKTLGSVDTAGEKKSDLKKQAAEEQKSQESVYTMDEFCSSAQMLFRARPECVRAAFKERGVVQCSKAEAEKIVDAFMKKEVK